MPEAFDPYYRWLLIPPDEQPASYYRLLGLKEGESDPEVIENAADQRMNHVRTLQNGPQAALSQRILNELATAKHCLMNPQKKAAYDGSLRGSRAKTSAAAAPAVAVRGPARPAAVARPVAIASQRLDRPIVVAPVVAEPVASPLRPRGRTRQAHQRSPNQVAILGAAATAVLAICAGAWWILSTPADDRPATAAVPHTSATTARVAPPPMIDEPASLATAVDPTTPVRGVRPVAALPEAAVADSAASVSLDVLAQGHKPLDLLPKIIPARDAIWGTWRLVDGELTSTAGGETRLQIPLPVPSEYILEVTVKRERAEPPWAALVFGLVTGDHHCGVVIDHEEFSALWPVDGRDLKDNPTSVRGWQIQGDAPMTVRCLVRSGQVRIEIEGRRLIDFHGDFSRLGCGWGMPRRDRLCLGSNAGFTFQRVVLIPLTDVPSDDADPPGATIAAAIDPADQPANFPDDESARSAAAEIRTMFARDIADARQPGAKLALAEKLIRLAKECDRPSERLALWHEGAQLALAGNSPALALEANDAIAAEIGGDRLQLCAELLEEPQSKEPSTAARQELEKLVLARVDEAMAAGRFDLAERLLLIALAAPRKANDRAALKELQRRSKELSALRTSVAIAQAARDKLAADPDDRPADLELGTAECLALGDWSAGLPRLARSADGQLHAAAEQDLATPVDAGARMKTADAWWDLSEKESGLAADQLRSRAGYWYRQALGDLSGISKVKVEKRLAAAPTRVPHIRSVTPIVSTAPGIFLVDLVPEEVRLGEGSSLLSLRMIVGEIESPHSLLAHVISNSSSHVAYRLPGNHRFLVGKVGLNDYIFTQPGQTNTPLTFRIVSDGVELWKSRPLQIRGESQKFRVDVSGVSKLELFADCPGAWDFGQAMWVEPRLTNRPDDSHAQLPPAPHASAAPKIEVLDAGFGGGNNWVDLREKFRPLAHDTSLIFTTHLSRLADPAPGWQKTFRMRYRLGDNEINQEWGEDQVVTLGAGSLPEGMAASRGLVIGEAAWGAAYVWFDVTEALKGKVRSSQLHVRVRGDLLGADTDPLYGVGKMLYIHYWFNGQPHLAKYWDNDQFTIGQDQ